MDKELRRVNNLFETAISFENLTRSFYRALKGSAGAGGYRFFYNLEHELLKLRGELKDMAYKPSDYRYFEIYDPKERTISVAPFRDRVVHHAVTGVLEPVYEKRFIFDSYATRKGKGTHRAVERAQYFLKRNRWFLKADIKKYFESIDHGILIDILKRKIKDRRLLELIEKIIHRGGDGRGLPIGNLTSQFFANVYLDVFDHFIKDELSVKCYIRYMDDMVIFSDDKEYVKWLKESARNFLTQVCHFPPERQRPEETALDKPAKTLQKTAIFDKNAGVSVRNVDVVTHTNFFLDR